MGFIAQLVLYITMVTRYRYYNNIIHYNKCALVCKPLFKQLIKLQHYITEYKQPPPSLLVLSDTVEKGYIKLKEGHGDVG